MSRRDFLGLLTGIVIAVNPAFTVSPTNDELISTTLKQYRSIMVDDLTQTTPFFQLLKQKGMIC